MVLALVDDLLFSSKIRGALQPSGVLVQFVRQRDAALTAIRENRPALVILDLDRSSLDPIGVIRELKADAALRDTRLVGFVSHVNADRIAEARAAGIDQVLARSAFFQSLPQMAAALGPTGAADGPAS
jgi:CheY-like chemotaxis protein